MKNLNKFIFVMALLLLVPLVSAGRSIHWEGVDVNGTLDMLGFNVENASNITADSYFKGQPLDGSIGSGVIWADEVDAEGDINVTHTPSTLDVTYPDLIVRLVKTDNAVEYCNVSGATVTVTDNQHSVFYIDSDCAFLNTSMATYVATDLSPGGLADIFNVMAHEGDAEVHKGVTVKNKETIKVRKENLLINHLKVTSGMAITSGTWPEYTQSSGSYLYIRTDVTATAQNTSVKGMELVGNVSGTVAYSNQSGINLTYCDTGTDLDVCSNVLFRRYVLFTVGYSDGDDDTYLHQLAPINTETYASVGLCLDTVATPISYTLPAIYEYTAVPIAIYCGRRSDTSWTTNFIDLRSGTLGFGATPDLSHLLNEDGSNPLTADWPAGNYNITAEFKGFFYGVYDWIISGATEYLGFNGTDLQFNETKLNETIDTIIVAANDSMKTYVDAQDLLDDMHQHAAENTTAGTFASGDYQFPGAVNITDNLNMTENNITDLQCIEWMNGAVDCGSS